MRARGIAGLSFVVACMALTAPALAGGAPAKETATPPPPPAAPATPQSFDELAATATPIARADLPGWAWALTATCSDGDEVAQRQCRIVRDARVATMRAQTFLIDAEPTAFLASAYDPGKKSIALTVRGCISCAGVDVGGKKLFIVANKASPVEAGSIVQAAVIHETARTFADEASATAWRDEHVARLTVQLVFAIPAGNPLWARFGKDGIAVQVLGFRVHDPCDGSIVCASPTATKLEPDKKACGTVDEGTAEVAREEDVIPDHLEPWQIQKALAPAAALAQQCHETYGVDGQAKIKLTINGDGSLATFEQTGDFSDTPTGACIAKAVKTITFPKSKKAKTAVVYPIVLR